MTENDLPTQLVLRSPYQEPAVRLYLNADEHPDAWVYREAGRPEGGYRVFIKKPRPLLKLR